MSKSLTLSVLLLVGLSVFGSVTASEDRYITKRVSVGNPYAQVQFADLKLWRVMNCSSHGAMRGTVTRVNPGSELEGGRAVAAGGCVGNSPIELPAKSGKHVPSCAAAKLRYFAPKGTSFKPGQFVDFVVENAGCQVPHGSGKKNQTATSGHRYTLHLKMKLSNNAPRVFRESIELYNGIGRKFYFPVGDKDHNVNSILVKNISGGCRLKMYNLDTMTAASTVASSIKNMIEITDQLPKSATFLTTPPLGPQTYTGPGGRYFFKLYPPKDSAQKWADAKEGTKCQINYQATDVFGITSGNGVLSFVPRTADQAKVSLKAYADQVTCHPGEYCAIHLRGSTSGTLGDVFFGLEKIPEGDLYIKGGAASDKRAIEEDAKKVRSSHWVKITNRGELPVSGAWQSRGHRLKWELFWAPPPSTPKGKTYYLEYYLQVGSLADLDPDDFSAALVRSDVAKIELFDVDGKVRPQCGTVTMDPVYAERPVTKIPWNFTAQDGTEIAGLTLNPPIRAFRGAKLSGPIGGFYIANQSLPEAASPESVGKEIVPKNQMFSPNPAENFVFFMVYPNVRDKLAGKETFMAASVTVHSTNGKKCVMPIKIFVRAHDFVSKDDAKKKITVTTTGTAVRKEHAWVGRYNLFPLRGLANKTLPSGDKIVGVKVETLPKHGKLFSLKQDGVKLMDRMYGTYCSRTDCSLMANKEMVVAQGSEIKPTAFENATKSRTLLRVLYQADRNLPSKTHDTFSYRFMGESGEVSSWLQVVDITLKMSRVRSVMEFKYSEKNSFVELDFNSRLPPNSAVEIVPSDMKNSFNIKRKFKLFQLKGKFGNRPIAAEEVGVTNSFGGKEGYWLKNNNTALYSPNTFDTAKPGMFRIRVYSLDSKGEIDKTLANEYSVFRVKVARNNHLPVWDPEDCEHNLNCPNAVKVAAGKNVMLAFSVHDEDDDPITFRVTSFPKYGTLQYLLAQPSGQVTVPLVPGMPINMGKSSESLQKSVAFLIYTHNIKGLTIPASAYPLQDFFFMQGTDGAGWTKKLKANLTITNTNGAVGKVGPGAAGKKNVRESTAVGVAVMVMIAMLVLATAILVKVQHGRAKRQALARGGKYEAPGARTEMAPVE